MEMSLFPVWLIEFVHCMQNVHRSPKNLASTLDPDRVCWFLGMNPSIGDNQIFDHTRTRGQTVLPPLIIVCAPFSQHRYHLFGVNGHLIQKGLQ
jgi:hypothetical protein